MGAGVGGKAGMSIVLDFKNDSFGFYPHYGYMVQNIIHLDFLIV